MLTIEKLTHYDAADRISAVPTQMKRTTILLIAAGLGLAAATNAAAQDAAAPIRRDSPTPTEEPTAPAATPAPAPIEEAPVAPPPVTPSPTPSESAATATPAKAEATGKASAPATPGPGSRAIEEKPVRPMEKRPASAPKPDVEEDRAEPRTGLPPASKPTFDLSDSGGGYVAATVRNLENRWQAAVAKHEPDVIDDLLADDFIGTSSTGKIGSKSTLLYELKRDKNTYSSATARGLIVRSFGPNVAVVAGTAKESGTTQDGQRFSNSSRFTDTWVQRNGRWQCVASHVSQLPKR